MEKVGSFEGFSLFLLAVDGDIGNIWVLKKAVSFDTAFI